MKGYQHKNLEKHALSVYSFPVPSIYKKTLFFKKVILKGFVLFFEKKRCCPTPRLSSFYAAK